MITLTPWFDGSIKPARVGVYERNYGDGYSYGREYSFWDGRRWMCPCYSPDDAARETAVSAYQKEPWRGLMWVA